MEETKEDVEEKEAERLFEEGALTAERVMELQKQHRARWGLKEL